MKQEKELSLTEALNIEKEIELLESKLRTIFIDPGMQTVIAWGMDIGRDQLNSFRLGKRKFSIKRMIEIIKFLSEKKPNLNILGKQSLISVLNIEKEIELLESKIRIEFKKEGIQSLVHHKLDIDRNQLSRFKRGEVRFSLKRMIEIVRVLVNK
jgi:hypothetical protein